MDPPILINHPHFIDPHALNFTANLSKSPAYVTTEDGGLYDVPVGIIILLSLFYGSISIVAVVGNTLVIWIVATTKQMQTVTNLFIANLALADVVIGMFAIPFQFQAAVLQRWNLPYFMCPFLPFAQTVSVNVSVFTLTAIAVDRHRAIINPLRARPPKYVSKVIIVFIWIISLLFSLPFMIAFRVYEATELRNTPAGEPFLYSRPFCDNVNLSSDQLLQYRYYLTFVQYFIPFCVISFVYIQMAIRLWGSKTPGNAQDSRDVTLMRNKKRVIKMLIIVVLLFGFCWFPLQLYNVLHVTWDFIDEFRYINIVWFCCDWLAMSNSCYNPFIYGIYNEKFKREFRRRFPMFRRGFDTTDMSEKNVSMCTRASSIRSTYTTASTKTKFLIPQRIVGGASVHHPAQYNALTVIDSSKNNNIGKKCDNGCKQWGAKSSWLFNRNSASAANTSRGLSTVTAATATPANDWRSTKNIPNCPKVYYNNDQAAVAVASNANKITTNKNVYFQPVNQQVPMATSHDDISKNCCCQQYQNNFLGTNHITNLNGTRRLSNTDLEQIQLGSGTSLGSGVGGGSCGVCSGSVNGDDDSLSDVDFRKSIIKINNIYNSCRDAVYGNSQSKGFSMADANEEKYSLVDCHGNAMKLTLNEDEVIL